MYPKEYFLERFQSDDSQDLLHRYATSDLTDQAKEAILQLLMQRGISEEKIEALVKQARGTEEFYFYGILTRNSPIITDSGEYVCPRCCAIFSGSECPVCHEKSVAAVNEVSTEVAHQDSKKRTFGYLILYLFVATTLGMSFPAIVLAGAFVGYILDMISMSCHDSPGFGTAVLLFLKWCLIGAFVLILLVLLGVFFGVHSR